MKGLLFSLFLLLSGMSLAADHSPERLLVKLHDGTLFPESNLVISKKELMPNLYLVFSHNIEKLEQELISHGEVKYVEKDYYGTKNKLSKLDLFTPKSINLENQSTFNDPYFSRQWTLAASENNGISVTRAYEARRASPKQKIIVAVVDTGVDANHEDIPIWTNAGEIPGNGIDDDNNGYIDDIHGINTLVRDSQGNATMDTSDAHSHGTHVSGSIAAKQNNGKGIVGIASNVEIMAIRTVPNSSDELDSDVIEAFVYAAKNGAKVINCSFGKDHNEGGNAVSEAIDYIGKVYGVLVVAAAGNDSSDIDRRLTYPASFTNENLLVVASTSQGGSMSYFSNYGAVGVDVAAPGSSIYSCLPGNRYGSMSGTSMASPNTVGVAAHLLSLFPELSAIELKELVMRSVTKVSAFSGKMVSGGRIDLDRAIQMGMQLNGQY